MKQTCTACNATASPLAKFCPECGEALQEPSKEVVTPSSPPKKRHNKAGKADSGVPTEQPPKAIRKQNRHWQRTLARTSKKREAVCGATTSKATPQSSRDSPNKSVAVLPFIATCVVAIGLLLFMFGFFDKASTPASSAAYCRDCSHTVSRSATICPNCGASSPNLDKGAYERRGEFEREARDLEIQLEKLKHSR